MQDKTKAIAEYNRILQRAETANSILVRPTVQDKKVMLLYNLYMGINISDGHV